MMALYSIPFHDFLHDGPCQRFSFWRKSHGTLKTGWSISGGKGCHLLQKEVFRQKEKRWWSSRVKAGENLESLQPMGGYCTRFIQFLFWLE
jgi:hypothetical protein